MLYRDRCKLGDQFYDYIFIVELNGAPQTHVLSDIKLLEYHMRLAKIMQQTYTAYTWNEEHSCYVQSSCYPTLAWPNISSL